jgi:hypothetical protein
VIYIVRLNTLIRSLKGFHDFLNNYNQTPRSKNLRKYKPQQDVVFEELSAFERSFKSSLQAKPSHGPYFNFDFEKGVDDQSVSQRALSMRMVKSSIKYDEVNNVFEVYFYENNSFTDQQM